MSTRKLALVAAALPHAIGARVAHRKWAVVELHLSTPITFDAADPLTLARHFEWEARLSAARSEAIRKLVVAGYTMDRPSIRCDEPQRLLDGLQRQLARAQSDTGAAAPLHCDGFLDFDLRFRKRYLSHQRAEEEVRRLCLHAGDNWDLGWDERSDGEVAWWCSVEDLVS